MGDFKFNVNSNVGSVSSVDFPANSASSSSLFFTTPTSVPDTISSHQQHTAMQDDLLIEKSAVKNQQLSPNPEVSGESIVKPKEEENTPREIGNGVSQTDTTKSSDQGQGGSSSVTTPLQLGTGFNVSEPSLNVINTSNTSTASLWSSGSIEDGLLHGLNVPAVNGTLPFQNFPPSNPNPLFNTSLGPQIAPGLPQSQSQQQPQRRAITATHNFPHNISRHIQGGSHPQNVFMAGKGYAASWSAGPQQHQSTWSPAGPQGQNAAGLSPWSRGRSVPNLNPLSSMGNMGSLGNRKPSPTFNHQQHSGMVISPIKFRRSTSYPGKGLFPQPPTFEITNMDENRDALFQYQERTMGNANGTSPLDNMRSLEHYLNDLMRGAGDAPEHLKGFINCNTNALQSLAQLHGKSPFFPGLDETGGGGLLEETGGGGPPHPMDGGGGGPGHVLHGHSPQQGPNHPASQPPPPPHHGGPGGQHHGGGGGGGGPLHPHAHHPHAHHHPHHPHAHQHHHHHHHPPPPPQASQQAPSPQQVRVQVQVPSSSVAQPPPAPPPPLGSPSRSSPHSQGSEAGERYSRKVFVGGLPPDIDEDEITASFRRFGPLVVDWPHKAESKSYFPPKGYAFLLFQDESSVQQLIDACIQDEDKLYLCVSSPTIKDKPVQIRPWRLSDADFVLDASMPLDPRKTVFVGGVPRPLKAVELAMIMDRLYGGVCYAGIDTDPELKYPKGAGRVAFSNQQSYIAAISARFVQLQHGDIDKRVEVKPYVLDDQMCDECQGQRCGGKFAPFFCANVTCLQYYCEHCWATIHSRPGREFHKPLVKEGADRPRAVPFRWC
ncbi:cytoplasmic polyadenylation element-binding protein 3 isoform X1 [Hetaerina americana]|uniref:cytoplasmic polyadenylation element-binding protein 3 isoform X1 n=1 Tax=Hetaerina americana TaxID=62018 RepID=UPI003A7F5075